MENLAWQNPKASYCMHLTQSSLYVVSILVQQRLYNGASKMPTDFAKPNPPQTDLSLRNFYENKNIKLIELI